jgi:hypothetical protein
MVDTSIIKRLLLSRYLYRLSADNARLETEVAAFASINLLQDALEIFLLAAADHLNAAIKPKTDFPQYLDLVNEKLPEGSELPFRRRLLEINKVRVFSKHDGIRPDQKELSGYIADARAFLDEATAAIFGLNFWSISLVSLLDDGEAKGALRKAEEFFHSSQFESCLIECRKALYLEFESKYNIKDFEHGNSANYLLGATCSAPLYAKSAEYIAKRVTNPFDYIVIDHAHLDIELAKLGIEHGAWWNIWRLTPSVYRHQTEDDWLIKHEPHKTDANGIEDRTSHVLESTIDIVLAKHTQRRKVRWIRQSTEYVVNPSSGAPIYRSASTESEVVKVVPEGISELSVEFGTPGLDGTGFFWKVVYYGKDFDLESFFGGYLSDADKLP